MKFIIVKSRDEIEILLTAFWDGEHVQFNNVAQGLESTIKQWIEIGFLYSYYTEYPYWETELIRIDEERFIPCLADYLRRTTGFVIEEGEL